MVDPQRRGDGAVPVIPGRFYFTLADRDFKDTADTHYFRTDGVLIYEGFYHDFGPLNLSQLYRFCKLLQDKLAAPELKGKSIVYYSSKRSPEDSSNSAWLVGGYLICVEGKSAAEATAVIAQLERPPFIPFRDASQGRCTFAITLEDCFRGLFVAKRDRFFDFSNFNPDEYEFYERVENGDFNEISDKFIAFSGPSARKTEICQGVYTKIPRDYFELWRARNVTAIVRLNKKIYDSRDFVEAGFNHYDLYFLDGSVPPPAIAARFLQICDIEKGCVAVHCKAGLGRTGTLIGLWVMRQYRWTAKEFIAWNRIVRPGSIIGPQQYYLADNEKKMWAEGDRNRATIGKKAISVASLGEDSFKSLNVS
ncbi:dual specificity protein phosphatase CDC14A [Baffinella frigidus]|nr:dual specificity protein phosphatase CDC14A [Cryptophyta sp. CCMP2293]|mmetsp:Transcript_44874/g.106934  ORF Transcript_44874/g.106934 Transcript_44874/m.106934 type:complete len:365 (+) Transcript_44874:199-1293(+)